MTKAVREQTIKAVDVGHFRRKQDDGITIRTKATTSTSRKSTLNKGTAFSEVEEDNKEEEEEEKDLPLPTYEDFFVKME